MDIIISNSSGQPIYEQICRQVKGAYEELERDGFICTVAGKGSFVAQQDVELARESSLREIEGHLQSALELSRQIKLPIEELQGILQVLSEEE